MNGSASLSFADGAIDFTQHLTLTCFAQTLRPSRYLLPQHVQIIHDPLNCRVTLSEMQTSPLLKRDAGLALGPDDVERALRPHPDVERRHERAPLRLGHVNFDKRRESVERPIPRVASMQFALMDGDSHETIVLEVRAVQRPPTRDATDGDLTESRMPLNGAVPLGCLFWLNVCDAWHGLPPIRYGRP